VTIACRCGAVGEVLPRDFGYEHDVRPPLVRWCGGEIGAGRAAIEDLQERPSTCPVCRHGRCAYVALPPAAGR
jgi:hypothetical protein